MQIEKIAYESRPYVFLLMALGAFIYAPQTQLLIVSASILFLVAARIIVWRMQHRGVLAYARRR